MKFGTIYLTKYTEIINIVIRKLSILLKTYKPYLLRGIQFRHQGGTTVVCCERYSTFPKKGVIILFCLRDYFQSTMVRWRYDFRPSGSCKTLDKSMVLKPSTTKNII